MVNILAVTDTVSQMLENTVSKMPDKLKSIELILSCGDLDSSYLEFLVDGLNKEFFFVCGNHNNEGEQIEDDSSDGPVEKLFENIRTFPKKVVCHAAGQYDLHGRIEVYGSYIIAGFGGSGWYSGRGNEYTERQMASIVRKVIRKIILLKLRDKIMRRAAKEVIVISHAPVFEVHDRPDPCHKGFKCFIKFIKSISPILWIHGHIHLRDINKNEITVLGGTTIINAFGHKFIKIDKSKIDISSRLDILDK